MDITTELVAKSPTRVDLAGGTIDLWPLYLFLESAPTINLAIDIFTEARLKKRDDDKIVYRSLDQDYTKEFVDIDEALDCLEREWSLVRAHLKFWHEKGRLPQGGFELSTCSESPIGGGLGGSSSLCISLIKLLSQYVDHLLNEEEMVRLASNIEAQILKTPTGTQDYYPPFRGGVNHLEYCAFGANCETLDVVDKEFEERFLLVYTGRPHHSGLNNWQVMKAAVEGDEQTLQCLRELKNVAVQVVNTVVQKDWNGLATLFKEEYRYRVQLCEAFSSPEIVRLENLVMGVGADAVKICGAGGGGCVIVWCDPQSKEQVREECQKAGFQVLNAKPVPPLEPVTGLQD